MFDNLKEKVQQRIEKNTYSSDLTWTDKEGRAHTEKVLLKRTRGILGDWVRIHPPVVYDSQGNLKWNLVNLIFGGKSNFIKLILIGIIIGMVLLQFYNNYMILEEAIDCCNACNFKINPYS